MKTSVIVLAYNQLEYTKLCLSDLFTYTPKAEYELIVVNNGSTDGTQEWLEQQEYVDRIIYNESNVGVTKAFNQGIQASTHEEVFLLGNDVLMTKGWLSNLRRALHSTDDVAMVVPATNSCSNFQSITVPYTDLDAMQEFAEQYNVSDPSQWEQRIRLIPFCALCKKEALLNVGGFDERYPHSGFFSDDDLSFSLVLGGYRLLYCKDTFVHHFGSITVNKPDQQYSETLIKCRGSFLDKWGFDAWEEANVSPNLLTLLPTDRQASFSLLEIECGCGVSLMNIRNHYPNSTLYGVESNERAAQVASQVFNIKIVDAMKEKPDWPDGMFDTIHLRDLPSIAKTREVLRNVRNLLKPTGHVLFQFQNIMFVSTIRSIMNGSFTAETSSNLLNLQEVVNMLNSVGLSDVNVTCVPGVVSEEDRLLIELLNEVNQSDMTVYYESSMFLIRAGVQS